MTNRRIILYMGLVVALVCLGGKTLDAEIHFQIEILSEGSINFTTGESSFPLRFSDFRAGSLTTVVGATYSISANSVVRTEGVVLARLDSPFPDIAFQAQFVSYTKNGGNARLVPAQSGYVTVGVQDVGLADKVADSGNGQMLDGTFVINYRAQAINDLIAGSHFRILTVTFTEV